jgi:hypothetical protein
MGQIGVHYPREMIRVERDYSGGELVQSAYQRCSTRKHADQYCIGSTLHTQSN